MNRIWKTAVVSLGIFCMSFTSIYAQSLQLRYDGGVHEYNLAPITLYINGEEIDTSAMPPIQFGGTTLVPVREVFEPLGANVQWNDYEKRVYITYEEKLIVIEMDSEYASVNGTTVKMSLAAKIINDKIMVPVRFISEELGFDVLWDNDTRHIYITDPNDSDEPTTPDEPTNPNDPEKPEWDFDKVLQELTGVKVYYEGKAGEYTNYVQGQKNNRVNITDVAVSEANNRAVVTINSSGSITDIRPLILDGRIVVDIENSTNNLSGSISVSNNSYVEGIRTSQFESDVTRVVIDLKSGASADFTLSPDRRSIIVEISAQPVQGIVVGQDSTSDYVYVDGLSPEQIDLDEDRNLDEISLVLPNMYLDEAIMWENIGTEYIKEVIITPEGNNTNVNIKIEGSENYVIQTSPYLEGTLLRVSEPTYRNIAYRNGSIYLDKAPGLSVGQISVQDNYRDREIVVDLGGNYQSFFGSGEHVVGDSIVKTIEITTTGTTKLIIDEQTVHAFNIIDRGEQIEIELVKPREKYDKIVVLDAGHGGTDPGASGNGVVEKNVVLAQALMVQEMLEANTDIKVYMSRDTDIYYTVPFRPELANEIEADLFVSFHANSFVSNSANGAEVYYFPDQAGQNAQMAQLFQNRIVSYTGLFNRGAKANSSFIVLKNTQMPAVLLEGGFVSNPADAAKLGSKEFMEQYSRAVYECIVEIFDTMIVR